MFKYFSCLARVIWQGKGAKTGLGGVGVIFIDGDVRGKSTLKSVGKLSVSGAGFCCGILVLVW